MLKNARLKAKKAGVKFGLKRSDLEIPNMCPLTGTVIKHQSDGGNRDDSPMIILIDQTGDYTPSNTCVVSYSAWNMFKNEWLSQRKGR